MQNKIRRKIEIEKFFVADIWQYLFVIANVILVGVIFDRLLVGLMFCISHVAIRLAFDKEYHCNNNAHCIALTLGIVWVAIPLTLPIRLFLLASIPMAFLVCLLGYFIQDRIDHKKHYNDIKHLTSKEVNEICKELGYNKDKTDLARMFFVDRLSNKEAWLEMCLTQRNVEWDTITKYKYRITKEFNEYLQK